MLRPPLPPNPFLPDLDGPAFLGCFILAAAGLGLLGRLLQRWAMPGPIRSTWPLWSKNVIFFWTARSALKRRLSWWRKSISFPSGPNRPVKSTFEPS